MTAATMPAGGGTPAGGSRKNLEAVYPLSPMQQGMLFHSLQAPESGVYFEQLVCSLHGALDTAAFARAWQQVIDRHPVLRTAFAWKRLDKTVQAVHRQVSLPLEQLDWRDLSPAEQERALEQHRAAERREGFDLSRAPLMRLTLIRTGEQAYRLLWSHHHILLDGWSMPILLREVFTLYAAYAQGRTVGLHPARPYRDYIAWLGEQDMAAAETFWRKTLAGFTAPTALRLPAPRADRLPPGRPRTAEQEIRLSVEETVEVQNLVRGQGLTLSTVVQAAWALLLSRYSGEQDVVFGATVSGRPAALTGADRMVGLFINTLPVRAQLAPQAEVLPWLRQFQAELAEARQFEYSPLVDVQGWSEVSRDRPLFETILVFENYPVDELREALAGQSGGLEVRDVRAFEQTNYPLTLISGPGRTLSLKVSYDRSRFDDASVQRLLGHLRTLLSGMASAALTPGLRLGDLPLLTEAEQHELAGWNATAVSLPGADRCLHTLFEQQVARTPDAIALIAEIARPDGAPASVQLTYAELDAAAGRLAEQLRAVGVGPETIVGLWAERSPDMLIALLGILKAGGAYLPLEVTHPHERTTFMLEDSGTRVVVAQRALPEIGSWKLEAGGWKDEAELHTKAGEASSAATGLRIYTRDERKPASELRASVRGKAAPIQIPAPDNLAYVIYTSGSTGVPKGVLVEHRNIVNHALAMIEQTGLRPGDRMLQFVALSFDAAGEEFYPTLLSGATLVMPVAEQQMSGAELAALCERQRVTVLHMPAAVWHTLVDDLAERNLGCDAPLRLLMLGGDTPDVARLNAFGKMLRGVAGGALPYLNLYGPTEATITATLYRTTTAVSGFDRLPIGTPLPNVQVHLLDAHGRPVPVGIPGEIHIGGAGVARGYLNRPELTGERFVQETGSRLYRTGDLARRLPDGNIEFIGRADDQVKIRGFRVEPGEIEATLERLNGVRQAIILAEDDENLGKRLIAFVVADNGSQLASADLRLALRRRLPEHMIPSEFILVEALPLTSTGKVDRRALRLLAASGGGERQAPPGSFLPPRTPDEELVAGIFSHILGSAHTRPAAGNIAADASFFDLGGHSLLATRLVSRLRDVFGVELPLAALFDTPTVAGIAARVAAARAGGEAEPAPPVTAATRTVQEDGTLRLPVSFSQQRLWFLDQLESGSLFYNIPTVVRLAGELQVSALSAALDEIVRRHEVLRTVFAAEGGVPVQVILPALNVPLPVTDLTGLPEAEREAEAHRLARDEIRTPFDLATGPLLRARLFRLAEQEHIAVLTIHHIATDGWSMGVLVAELAALYAAFSHSERGLAAAPLHSLPLQYGDYAAWQRSTLQGAALERQLAYWKEQLAGLPSRLELPTDRPRPAVQTANGGTFLFRLPEELSRAIVRFNQQQGVTMFMTLLAAYQALLSRYSGQQDIAVGSAIANRTRAELEPLIGFFVNTLVFRTRFGPSAENKPLTFRELVLRVRETALGAYAHQDVPFEALVDALQPERDLSHTPLFQAAFSLQNVPFETRELPGLRLSPVEIDKGIAGFDMLLMMTETQAGITAAWEYNSDLFDRQTIERMAGHLETLLAAAIAAPEQPVAVLPLLPEAERRMMLETGNDTAVPFPDDTTIHALIEAQAAAQPDAVAVEYIGDLGAYQRGKASAALTYGQLNERADQLAHYLRSLGVGPGTLVGISVERSLDMIVGILGILKAGAAYLPLDPNYPAARLAFMVEDSGIPVLLTQARLVEAGNWKLEAGSPRLEAGSWKLEAGSWKLEPESAERQRTLIRLDADWTTIARQPTSDIPHSQFLIPNSLAYVIYTSGSTGRPKGALLHHRGLCNLADVQGRAFDIRPGKRVLQFAPFSFDASVWETVMALRNGATLVLARQDAIASGTELVRLLRAARITTVTLPPSLLAVLEPDDLPDLETVIAAGERCTNELVARWAGRHPEASPSAKQGLAEADAVEGHPERSPQHPADTVEGRRFFNAYGPTETTVCASMFKCDPRIVWPFGGPPIGGPIANFQLYIVDEHMQPQPIGVPGELLIGGAGLASGYLNRPELTAERFVPNPFLTVTGYQVAGYKLNVDLEACTAGQPFNLQPPDIQPGASRSSHTRLYRTGDLARWLPGGAVEFLGRIDDQVKVRGFRIELGEIEAVLREHPAVRDAVVIARGDTLAGYIVLAAAAAATPADLRDHLRRRLPEHMVPATFTLLDAFPITPSGKVDRRALAALPPSEAAERTSTAYIAPRTPVEETLARLAAELLKLPRVGVEDSFFELGGHSLLATQLISRIRDELKVEVPLKALFEKPTVAALAEAVEQAQAAVAGAEAARVSATLRQVKDMSPEQVRALLAAKKAAAAGKAREP